MEQKLILLGLAVAAVVAIGIALKPEDTSADCGAVALYDEPNAPELNRIERDIAVTLATNIDSPYGITSRVIAMRWSKCKSMKYGS